MEVREAVFAPLITIAKYGDKVTVDVYFGDSLVSLIDENGEEIVTLADIPNWANNPITEISRLVDLLIRKYYDAA